MKNKLLKIFILLLISLVILVHISNNYSFATDGDGAIDFEKATIFIDKGSKVQGIKDLSTIGRNFSGIGTVLIYIGAGVLVAGMGYIGIMYMISPPDRRGKLKQQLIGLVVSGIVIFGAYSIWSVLVNLLAKTIDA